MVTRMSNGKLVWLETGNATAGLTHITTRHAGHFAARGITDIPSFLHRTLQTSPINTGIKASRPFAEFSVSGNMYRVAHGTNGFIVTFYPI